MDYIFVSDAARWVAVVGSYLMAAFVARATWETARRYGVWTARYPSPVSGAALVAVFILGSVRRFDGLGTPGDFYLWAYLVVLAAFFVGTNQTVHLLPTPRRWRRRDR